MRRPDGPLRISRTKVLEGGDVIVADLAGKCKASVAAIRRGSNYYFVAPAKLAGKEGRALAVKKTEGCSLTDCVNLSVRELGMKLGRKARRKKR